MENKKWYKANNANDTQGLVISEDTGENIAITYNADNAALISAAPELLEALKNLLLYSTLSPDKYSKLGLSMGKCMQDAKQAIAKAEGK